MRSIDETKKLLTSPLHQWHRSHKANMAPFGDYELPLWYGNGAKAEHLAVLSHAGLFDTSHMTALILKGTDSFTLLQHFFSRNLLLWGKNKDKPLPVGRGVYGVFLDNDGCLLDDSILYRVGEDTFLICLNSGKGALIADHLNTFEGIYALTDLTGTLTKIDLQGPASAKILSRTASKPEEMLKSFPPFSCKGSFSSHFTTEPQILLNSGVPVFIARSGYTGEFGFEIFSTAEFAQIIWEELITAGQDLGIMPCGLAARDSLRTGAGLPLAGHDIGSWPFINNPWEFALPYNETMKEFSKDFFGSAKLLRPIESYTYAFAGYDLRKVASESAVVLSDNGQPIGDVLTCVTDMAIGRVDKTIVSVNSPGKPEEFLPKGLCCGFLKIDQQKSYGDNILLKDKHRKIEVEIVKNIRPNCSAHKPLKHFL